MLFNNLFKPAGFCFAPDAGGSGGGDGDKTEEKQEEKTVTMTQAQLDVLFAERATRASATTLADLLKKAGVENVDALLAGYAEAKKLKEAQMTDKEKSDALLKTAQDEAAQAKKDLNKALAQMSENLKKAEVMAQAAAQGFRPESVDDVWLVVDKTKVTEKDGVVSGAKEAVAEVAKQKPFWLNTEGDKKSNGTPRQPEKKQGGDNNNSQVPQRPRIRL
jgi:hypothetical protein